MSFSIVTDTAANLPRTLLQTYRINVIPFSYCLEEKEYLCPDMETFDDSTFYGALRKGVTVTTSQIPPQRYIEHFEPILQRGEDLLFVGLSSGVSGSFASAQIAARMLREQYPDRTVLLLDSLGAGLGEGLLALRAARCRAKGMTVAEAFAKVSQIRDQMYQVFTVDDLKHLKRTGRLSNLHAAVGTLLGIKPLLKGNEEGKIVAFEKIRSRRQTILALAEKYFTLAKNPEKQIIGISHADCPEDAEVLAELIRKKLPPKDIYVCKHEPVTGSHIGAGALALFFEGDSLVRLR